jgi:enamine deaminase RidA (YjgF/YER057c/UK114 family)
MSETKNLGKGGLSRREVLAAGGAGAAVLIGLRSVLEAAGASLADVVELMTFHTDLRGEMQAFASVKDEYFRDRYPSWTAVGVTQLALPELCVEIRAVAVVGCGGPDTATEGGESCLT